jgi:cyanophycinase-like exopeptidase
MANPPGTVTLIGSGELGETMAKTHRQILAQIAAPVNAVFLDTPAGFQVNADEISAKAVEYFKQHFNIPLAVASFKSKQRATAHQVAETLNTLRRANFIFAGPGSPSYAVNNWRGSVVWDALVAQWLAGAHLMFASAAAIAIGCAALPVYEIYKAGHDVAWLDGLDLFGRFGLKWAIVPHWNNAEGQTYDTRFCFMGASRFQFLEAQLPWDVVVIGIDEHTALTLDFETQRGRVSGVGNVTIRYAGDETTYPSGNTIPFEQMSALGRGAPAQPSEFSAPSAPAAPAPQVITTTLYLDQLARALKETVEPNVQRKLIEHVHAIAHELAPSGHSPEYTASAARESALVELLLRLRHQLRLTKQYALADQIRQSLAEVGIVVEDTPTGSIWRRKEAE